MDNQYVLNRLGLINFWYYQNQTFDLSDGHLLLRGSNGAGKSVTMQSLLPVLLDGNTEAGRLDSFGSRDRNMKDYLLGEKDVSGKDEAIGYLWAEYKMGNKYITTGIGMHGRRNSNLNRWYFVINDDRRINEDFSLLSNETKDSATPLSKKQLKNRLQVGGNVYDKRQDYAGFVKNHIFGFNSMDDFNDTIRLLIQLRNPKLNKDFKPDDLERILSDSLPSLSDDNVQSSAQTLNQIDEANRNIAESNNQERALKPLLNAFMKYRTNQLISLAYVSNQHLQKTTELNKFLEQSKKDVFEIKNEENNVNKESSRLEIDLHVAEDLREELANDKGFDLVKQGLKLKGQCQSLSKQSNRKQLDLDSNLTDISSVEAKRNEISIKRESLESNLSNLKNEMEKIAQKSGYAEQHRLFLSLVDDEKNIDYRQWQSETQKFGKHLDKIIELFRKVKEYQLHVNELDKELGENNQKLSHLEMDKRDWESSIETEIFELKDAFKDYRNSLSFEVSGDVIGQIGSNLDKIYSDEMIDFVSVIKPLTKEFTKQEANIAFERQINKSEMHQVENEIQDLLEQQEKIRKQKYPIPERNNYRRKVRSIKNGIPFYQLLDFDSDTDSHISNKIEGALLEGGILDALVVSNNKMIIGDTELVAHPLLMQTTLADYLHPDLDEKSEITDEQVMNLLSSIAMDESNPEVHVIVKKTGEYKLGILHGTADANYTAQYIGASAQKRYREQKIAEIQKEIDNGNSSINNLKKQMKANNDKQVRLKDDKERQPTDNNLREYNKSYHNTLDDIDRLNKDITEITVKLKKNQHSLQEVKLNMNSETVQDRIQKTEKSYLDAKNHIRQYLNYIGDWRQNVNNIMNCNDRINDSSSQLNQLQGQLIQKQTEMKLLQNQLQEVNSLIVTNHRQQESAGNLDKIRQQLMETKQRISKIKQDQKNGQNKLLKLTHDFAIKEQAVKEYQDSLKFEQPFTKLIKTTLGKELSREVGDSKQTVEELLLKLLKNPQPSSDQLGKDINNLTNQFNRQSNNLLDYRPRQMNRNTIEEPEWLNDFGDQNEAIDFWRRSLNHQFDIVVELSGMDESITILDERLNTQIQINQEAMTTQEEQLFKTIIFEGLGNIIRQRINKAQLWVDKINKVLKLQENNSNLKLNIEWKIKPSDVISDSENREVIELFKRDPNTLTDADLSKIKKFLNSKIKSRKNDYIEQEKTVQMTTVLREALDYREWFQFRLFYTQVGRAKRQLTRAVFNRFSGGEKAVTMYTPLFVAMSARYDNAAPKAPKIITLDEAFAGIDERNISELFKTIDHLNFNYVMNSQQLQAEYETVPSLNTYELLRPQGENGDVVTAVKMHWNGGKREN